MARKKTKTGTLRRNSLKVGWIGSAGRLSSDSSLKLCVDYACRICVRQFETELMLAGGTTFATVVPPEKGGVLCYRCKYQKWQVS